MLILVCESSVRGNCASLTKTKRPEEFFALCRELEKDGYHSPQHLPTGNRIKQRIRFQAPEANEHFTVTLWEI